MTLSGTSKLAMVGLGGLDARLQDLDAQLLVERADLDDQPAGQAGSDPLVERLEIGRRPVGGDEHLLAAVDQGVERVAELLLDRLAGQKLQVIDDEDVDRPQLLLERDRGLRLERGDEAVHEALGREVEHAPAAAFRQMRGRLDQMRLAEADRGMDEERIVGNRLAGTGAGDLLGGGMGERVGPADEEGVEGHAAVERRAGQIVVAAGRRLDGAQERHGRAGGRLRRRLDAPAR